MQKFYQTDTGDEIQEHSTYNICRCETCSEVLVYQYCQIFDASQLDAVYGDLVYPKQTAFNDAVPKRVRKIYLEAVKVKAISPIAYAVLARRVLEEISKDRGITEKNLAKALAELANRGELPPVLAEASALVRLIGNSGAHASDVDISPMQVWSIDDFIKAVIEYIYVAPSKVAAFKKSLEGTPKGENAG